MTIKTQKREWWNEFLHDKQTKKQKQSIHLDNRNAWVRACDMASGVLSRIRKLASAVLVNKEK